MRLIDADKLKEGFADMREGYPIFSDTEMLSTKDIAKIIDNAPTVDVENQLLGAELHGIKIGYEEAQKKLIQKQGEWIPIKYRPMTSEERRKFAEHYGIEYCDTLEEKAFDCSMPEDGQEILISTLWGVVEDVADNDIDGEGFICYGLEGNGDWDGVEAWMPKPERYKKGGEV